MTMEIPQLYATKNILLFFVAIFLIVAFASCGPNSLNTSKVVAPSAIDHTFSKVATAIELELSTSLIVKNMDITSITRIAKNERGLEFRATLYPKSTQEAMDDKRFVANYYTGGVVKIEEFKPKENARRIVPPSY